MRFSKPALSETGFRFRENLANAGIEITPDQLAEGIAEAEEMINDPDDLCRGCGTRARDIGGLRYGWCFSCVEDAERKANK